VKYYTYQFVTHCFFEGFKTHGSSFLDIIRRVISEKRFFAVLKKGEACFSIEKLVCHAQNSYTHIVDVMEAVVFKFKSLHGALLSPRE
jgi:hypothetical protein